MPSPFTVRALSVIFVSSAFLFAAGCASDGNGGASADASLRQRLPAVVGARWTPPEFATRPVDGERAAVLDACVAAANAMGFAVNRFDGATGKIMATRRPSNGFDGARQDMLEVTVTTLAPDVATVAVVLREAVESGADDERGGPMVTTALVRDRASYDAFFERVAEALVAVEAPAPEPVAAPIPATPAP